MYHVVVMISAGRSAGMVVHQPKFNRELTPASKKALRKHNQPPTRRNQYQNNKAARCLPTFRGLSQRRCNMPGRTRKPPACRVFNADATTQINYEEWFEQRQLEKLGWALGLSYTEFAFGKARQGKARQGKAIYVSYLLPPRSWGRTITLEVRSTGTREGRCIVRDYGRLPRPSSSSSFL